MLTLVGLIVVAVSSLLGYAVTTHTISIFQATAGCVLVVYVAYKGWMQ